MSLVLAVVSVLMTIVGDRLPLPGPDRIGSVSRQSELRLDPDTIRLGRIGLEFIAPGGWTALVVVLAVLLVVGPTVERRLGSWRYGLVLPGCQLAGFLFTTALTLSLIHI